MAPAEIGPASSLFSAQSARLCEAAALGPVVDLASGRGRHTLAAAGLGLRTLAIDRNAAFLRDLLAEATRRDLHVDTLLADLEAEGGIPLARECCGAALVFRFLHRPLAPGIAALLVSGGLLLYETFLVAQRELGFGPRRAEFLLEPEELPTLFPELEILEYDEGLRPGHRPEATARLVARKRS